MAFSNILKEFGMKDEVDLARRLDDDPDLSPAEFVECVKVEINGLKEENDKLKQFHEWDKIAALKLNDEKYLNEKLNKEIDELKEEMDDCVKKNKDLSDFADASVNAFYKLNKEIEELKKEGHKFKGYLGELGSLLDDNIDDSNPANSERPVTKIYADAFDKLTNNEFL